MGESDRIACPEKVSMKEEFSMLIAGGLLLVMVVGLVERYLARKGNDVSKPSA